VLPLNGHNGNAYMERFLSVRGHFGFCIAPLILKFRKNGGAIASSIGKTTEKKQQQLNALEEMDYDSVIKFKLSAIKEIYTAQKDAFKKRYRIF